MKKILFAAACFLIFGCNKAAEKENTDTEVETDTEIAPPMKGVEDSSLGAKVDTLKPEK
jgi:hypothetical protein